MLKLLCALLVAAAFSEPSQPPVPSVGKEESTPQKPIDAKANQPSQPKTQSAPNLAAFKFQQTEHAEQQREWKADYEQR